MPFYEKGDVRIRYEESGWRIPVAGYPRRRVEFPRQQLADGGVQLHETFQDEFRFIIQRHAKSSLPTLPGDLA